MEDDDAVGPMAEQLLTLLPKEFTSAAFPAADDEEGELVLTVCISVVAITSVRIDVAAGIEVVESASLEDAAAGVSVSVCVSMSVDTAVTGAGAALEMGDGGGPRFELSVGSRPVKKML